MMYGSRWSKRSIAAGVLFLLFMIAQVFGVPAVCTGFTVYYLAIEQVGSAAASLCLGITWLVGWVILRGGR